MVNSPLGYTQYYHNTLNRRYKDIINNIHIPLHNKIMYPLISLGIIGRRVAVYSIGAEI